MGGSLGDAFKGKLCGVNKKAAVLLETAASTKFSERVFRRGSAPDFAEHLIVGWEFPNVEKEPVDGVQRSAA